MGQKQGSQAREADVGHTQDQSQHSPGLGGHLDGRAGSGKPREEAALTLWPQQARGGRKEPGGAQGGAEEGLTWSEGHGRHQQRGLGFNSLGGRLSFVRRLLEG